jgi:superfamily II DNA or RNA helicase
MQKLRSRLAGQPVEVRGEPWVVVRTDAFDACTVVTLRGTGGENFGRTIELIEPFDRVRVAPASPHMRRASRRAVLRAAAAAVARDHGWLVPWVAARARMELLPWQFAPAMAAVAGVTRVLLADGVGLGKTIQAGLILAELQARGFISRALILTPASLREQWAGELNDRFGLNPVVLDHAALTRLANELPPGINPWSIAEIAISSIDLVKRGEVRRALDQLPLDALIVDEAHHLRPGTDRAALVEDLAARVPWLVLATATPHSGDERAYAFLRGLGTIPQDPGMQTFRRGPRVVGTHRARRALFHGVRATPAERLLFDATLAYAKAVWRRHHALVACVICRRAMSSTRALLRTLSRRLELIRAAHPPGHLQTALPWEENDERDAVEADAILGGSRLDDGSGECEWLERLVAMAERAEQSSKAGALERLLARTNEAVIVFSEYRDTLFYLQERLYRRASFAIIHGGLSAKERREAVHRFVSGGARVLLATDAAGEGLNLQERCRLVVNVELPWSPLRLEQRVGRVDRLGQTRRVHAIHLVHRGSFEDDVLARLERQRQQAAHDLSELQTDEHGIAAAVFAGDPQLARVTSLEPSGRIDRCDANEPCDVQVRRRAIRLLGKGVRVPQPLYASPAAKSGPTRRVMALFECDVHDGNGRLIAREALPLIVELAQPIVLRRRNTRTAMAAIATAPALRERLMTARAAFARAVASNVAQTGVRIERRLQQLIGELESVKQPLRQGSLFDRRVEQQARASEMAARQIRAHLEHRLASARSLFRVEASPPRLTAVWPVASE